jgi:hypothetical protein
LYGTLDAAIDGKLAEQFPESKGKAIVIELHGYNLPRDEVAGFLERFFGSVLRVPDYQRALEGNPFVREISFRSKLV